MTTQKKHNCCPKALCTQCNTPRMPFYHATYPPCPQRIRKNRPHNKDTSSTTTVPKRLAYKAQADIQYSVVAVHLFSHSVSPGNSSTTSLAFVWWLLGADLAFYGGQIAAMQQHPQPFPTTLPHNSDRHMYDHILHNEGLQPTAPATTTSSVDKHACKKPWQLPQAKNALLAVHFCRTQAPRGNDSRR